MKLPRRSLAVSAVLAVLAAALGAGCDTLPGGDPPPGALADNTPPPADTDLARHNQLVTQLTAYALQVGLDELDPGDDLRTAAIARDAAAVAGFRIGPSAALKLRLERAADGAETLGLSDAEHRIVWRSLPLRRP